MAVLSYRKSGFFHLVDISGFNAHIKQVPGHRFLDDPLVSIAQPGQTYPVAVIVLGNNVEKLNPACPAFYTVALHGVPPEGVPVILIIGGKNRGFREYFQD